MKKEKRNQEKPVVRHPSIFYSETDIILPTYNHLETPASIIQSVQQAQKENRKSSSSKGITITYHTSSNDFIRQIVISSATLFKFWGRRQDIVEYRSETRICRERS
ncbi:hypothetical protein [Salibacterium qingdaonense]|nr:hypothetical protein [Salibacterium qingdaonense]